MTSKIIVNNIESDTGVSTVTFGSDIQGNFVGSISVSGVTTVTAGSASAPSISPSGDSNTGIFFPSPDTIAFAEGGVEAARFDSNGWLGIGTANPQRVAHIYGASTSGTNLLIQTPSTATNSAGIQLIPSSGNTYEIQSVLSSTTYGSSFIVFDRTNDLYRMIIDSSGRITKPYQVYFYARTGRSSVDGITSNPYRFENVIHNVGGHFVTSGTGAYERFVAPIDGVYLFQSSPGYKQTSSNWNVRVRVNGNNYAEIGRFIGYPDSHSTIGGSVTLKLSANDYVDLTNDGTAYHINNTFNYFCGYLLG